MITCPPPEYVEIETARLCDRTCAWCPNGYTNARQEQELMEWSNCTSLLKQLAEHPYAGMLALHNYNEPLLNPRLRSEIRQVLQILPDSKPGIFTNGDYLNTDTLRELVTDGVRYVRVTIYPRDLKSRVEDDHTRIRKWLAERLGDLDVSWSIGPVRQGLGAREALGPCDLEIIAPAILQTYNYRGGTVHVLPGAAVRQAPCQRTTINMAIDYAGSLEMCCNVYPENVDHGPYVIGNVFESGLWGLWCSPKMDALRRAHHVADRSLSSICKNCNHMLPSDANR